MSDSVLLTLNSGSSSIKFQLFSATNQLNSLAKGSIHNLGTTPQFQVLVHQHPEKQLKKTLSSDCSYDNAIQEILDWINQHPQRWNITAVAHRIVHGGTLFQKSVLITASVLKKLQQLIPLAPLHQAQNLLAVEIISSLKPQLPQVACFDTAFHAHHTPLFTDYALPLSLREHGIRRYGFHGLSYEWIAWTLKKDYPELYSSSVIAAHLGNGASLCAMNQGVSIDTTMGLTALDGLPMGTRCGSLDPGAITYMIRNLHMSATEIEEILYTQSGLLGLSGLTNDVKQLEASHEKQAQFALDYFCLKCAQFVGMMAVSSEGINALVFTGGIGENSSLIRNNILKRIEFLKPFSVLIIPANEERMMAMHTLELL